MKLVNVEKKKNPGFPAINFKWYEMTVQSTAAVNSVTYVQEEIII